MFIIIQIIFGIIVGIIRTIFRLIKNFFRLLIKGIMLIQFVIFILPVRLIRRIKKSKRLGGKR